MLLSAYTVFHVLISLVAIVSGFVVVFGLLTARRLDGWTALFLWTTVATSVTGFFFPVHRFMPSHAIGIVSLIVLSVAIVARYPNARVVTRKFDSFAEQCNFGLAQGSAGRRENRLLVR